MFNTIEKYPVLCLQYAWAVKQNITFWVLEESNTIEDDDDHDDDHHHHDHDHDDNNDDVMYADKYVIHSY